MTAILFPNGKQYYALPNGVPNVGGKVYTYAAGTSTPQATYSDAAGTIPNTNPVVLDARGEALIFWNGNYKVVLKDLNDNTIWTVDNIVAANLSGNTGASQVGTSSGQTVQQVLNVHDALLRYVETADFSMNVGYDDDTGIPAAVRIGGNNAFSGTEGILVIGGAGPKDAGNGTYFGDVGHPNWPTLQPSISRNPVELALYGNGTSGIGTSTGTTTFTSLEGTFTSADVGRAIWLNGAAYTINTVTDATHVVLNSAPPAATYIWHIVYTTGSGTCTVSGGTVTRVTGDPFIPHTFGTGFVLKLNGVAYTVTATTAPNTYTISAPPGSGTYSYVYSTNINDQIAAMRVGPQFASSTEENVTLMARTMRYELRTLYAGSGQYRDLVIGSGESSPGNLAEQITANSDGALTLQKTGSHPVILGGTVAANKFFSISRAAGYLAGYRLQSSFLDRWALEADNVAESGGAAGSDFTISRFSDAGAALGTPFAIKRSNGRITLSDLQASTTYANDAAAAAGGVPLGGLYRNGSVVQIRVV